MKKLLSAALFALIILCSCAGLPDRGSLVSVLDTPYEAEAAIAEDGSIYRVLFSRDADGTVTVTFREPFALCGISYAFDGSGSRIVYKDLEIPVNVSDGGISTGVISWKTLLCADGGYTVRQTTENGRKIYVMSDGETEYRFDAVTGSPMLIKNEKTTITFTEFRNKNDKPSESTGPDITSGA